MDYREHVQRAIDYIEEHLKDEISNAELARAVTSWKAMWKKAGNIPREYIFPLKK